MKIESLLSLGILLIFIGIILIFISSFYLSTKSSDKSNVKVAAGGFIGPIPFGFFTDKKMFYIWLVFIAVIIILYFLSKKLF